MTILATTCPHCRTANIALLIVGSASTKEVKNRSAFLRCPKCKKASVAEMRLEQGGAYRGYSGPEEGTGIAISCVDFLDGGELLSSGWTMLDIWPRPEPPRIPSHLPQEIARALLAAEKNFPDEDLAETAAGAYGRALDLATQDKAPDFTGTLYARINHLAKEGKITKDLAEWAHHIRSVRNGALHGFDRISAAELAAVRGFTEMVLTYLYSLPGLLAEMKMKTPPDE